ncbi:UDP-glucose 4-epimerase GalE [Clostridium chrysemydis]|uniref:UDP-glucose 4-epimerase GalE n=1 Tax=Clostridium chrysemydis TaxID=2665504 RepID=UPI001883D287|nr:UDP-glucose 4-epimerase GalE [Clostridium chrysemydis]
MKILVTGGLGYIGSHTVVELMKNKNNEVIIIDNLSNSNIAILDRLERITFKKIKFYNIDIKDEMKLNEVFTENKIELVIHFAAYKSVGESVKEPLKYYDNNIGGTVTLLNIMKRNNVKNFIFSSSATVYGEQEIMPIEEGFKLKEPKNPYGKTKVITEKILSDLAKSDDAWKIAILRYFNPVGAHESGLIGELPNGIPNNLMPYLSKVAAGELKELNVFGNNYETKDGTGVRDYIHVVDLAKGHAIIIDNIYKFNKLKVYNLGTGNGYSVIEVIKEFEKISGKKINYKIVEKRKGDVGVSYASPKKINEELGWVAKKGLKDMCKDFWNWQNNGLKEIINEF